MDFYESIIHYDLKIQKNLTSKIDLFFKAIKNLDKQKQNIFNDENNNNITKVLQEINTSNAIKTKLFRNRNLFSAKKENKPSIKYFIFAKNINENTVKNNNKNNFNQKFCDFNKDKKESDLKNDVNKIVLDIIKQNVKNTYLKKINEKYSTNINNNLNNNYIKITMPINIQTNKVKKNNNTANINKIKRTSVDCIDCKNIKIQNENKFRKINAKNNNNNKNNSIKLHHLNIQKLHIKNIKVINNDDSFSRLLQKKNKKINLIKYKLCQKEYNNNISNIEQEEENKKLIEQKNNNNKSIQNISNIDYYIKTNNLNSCRMKKIDPILKNNRNKSNNNNLVDNRKNNFDILKKTEKKNRVYSGGVREENYYVGNNIDYIDTHCDRAVSNKRGVKVKGKRILSSIVYISGINRKFV